MRPRAGIRPWAKGDEIEPEEDEEEDDAEAGEEGTVMGGIGGPSEEETDEEEEELPVEDTDRSEKDGETGLSEG
jgi:hypothetical protein